MEVSLEAVSFFDFDGPSIGSKRKLEKYVDKVNLSITAGSVVAIVGSPTHSRHLLELIALRKRHGHIAGHVRHDNSTRKNGSCFRDIAYVRDFDSHYFDYLTVFDFLWWAARLRLNLSLTESSTRARESALLVDLNCLSWVRELDSGQRILLALAAELVSSPSLVCVQDPVDFKEEAHALSMAKMFRKVAHRSNTSTTVVFSCLAPSLKVLQQVDQVAVQYEARLVYTSGTLFDRSEAVLYAGAAQKGEERDQARDEIMTQTLDVIATISREVLRSGHGASYCLGKGQTAAKRGKTAPSHYQRESSKLAARIDKHVNELLRLKAKLPEEQEPIPQQTFESSRCPPKLVYYSPVKGGGDPREEHDEHGTKTPSSLALSPTPTTPPLPMSPPPRPRSPSFPAPNSPSSCPSRRRRLHPSRLVKTAQPVTVEVWSLLTRALACMRANPILIAVGVLRFVLAGVVLGLSSLNAGEQADYTDDKGRGFSNDDILNDDSFSVTSTLFFVVTVTLLGLAFSVPYMNSHFRMIKREITAGVVHPISAWVSLLIHDIPAQLIGCMFLGLVIRLFLGLEGEVTSYYSAVALSALGAVSLASAVAVSYHSAYEATRMYISMAAAMLLFAGYLQYIPEMPGALQWLTDLSFARWAFEALMLSSFQDSKTGQRYLDLFGFDDQHVSACVLWMLLWIFALQMAVLVGLYPMQYQSVYARIWGRQQQAVTTSESGGPLDSDLAYLLSEEAAAVDEAMIKSPLVDADLFGDNDDKYIDGTYHVPRAERKFSDDEELQAPPVPVVLLPASKRTSLSFKQIRYSMKNAPSSTLSLSSSSAAAAGESQDVLKGVTGSVRPGDLCCIVDASDEGAGGVLLQVLCGRASSTGTVDGEIKISDRIVRQGDRTHNAVFVMSGDSPAHSLLTVRETLHYSALLRRTDQRSCPLLLNLLVECASIRRRALKQSTEDDDMYRTAIHEEEMVGASGLVEDKVNELLRLFDLEEVAHVVIGREHERAISPSQMRCVTIAMECINRPGLLFLQDPFLHLDWYHTDRVCRVLKALAAGDRAIICSVPNCTDEIYSYFNRTLLLNKGLLMYFGASAEAREHFDNIGFQPQESQSTLSYLMDICHEKALLSSLSAVAGQRSSLLTAEDLANIRQSMDSASPRPSFATDQSCGVGPRGMKMSADEEAAALGGDFAAVEAGSHLSVGPVIMRGDTASGPAGRVMLRRRSTVAFRNRHMVFLYQLRSVFVSVLLGCVWFNIDDGEVESRVLLAAVAYVYIVASLADLFDGTHRRQTDYLRERSNGAATAGAYWLADIPPAFMHTLPQAFVFATPFYVMAGLRGTFSAYMYFCFILFLALVCNIGMMYFVSAMMKSPRVSQVLFLGIILPLQILFSGSVIYLSSMAEWLSWGALLNPMHFYLTGVFENEFEDNSSALGSKAYESVKNEYGFVGNSDTSVVALLFIGVLYRMLWLLSLKHREIIQQRYVLQKVVKAAHRKVKVLVTAGLRFSKRKDGYTDAAELDEDYAENGFPALHHDEEVAAEYSTAVSQQSLLNQLYRHELPQQEAHLEQQQQNHSPTASARLSRQSQNRIIVVSKSSKVPTGSSPSDNDSL